MIFRQTEYQYFLAQILVELKHFHWRPSWNPQNHIKYLHIVPCEYLLLKFVFCYNIWKCFDQAVYDQVSLGFVFMICPKIFLNGRRHIFVLNGRQPYLFLQKNRKNIWKCFDEVVYNQVSLGFVFVISPYILQNN